MFDAIYCHFPKNLRCFRAVISPLLPSFFPLGLCVVSVTQEPAERFHPLKFAPFHCFAPFTMLFFFFPLPFEKRQNQGPHGPPQPFTIQTAFHKPSSSLRVGPPRAMSTDNPPLDVTSLLPPPFTEAGELNPTL